MQKMIITPLFEGVKRKHELYASDGYKKNECITKFVYLLLMVLLLGWNWWWLMTSIGYRGCKQPRISFFLGFGLRLPIRYYFNSPLNISNLGKSLLQIEKINIFVGLFTRRLNIAWIESWKDIAGSEKVLTFLCILAVWPLPSYQLFGVTTPHSPSVLGLFELPMESKNFLWTPIILATLT